MKDTSYVLSSTVKKKRKKEKKDGMERLVRVIDPSYVFYGFNPCKILTKKFNYVIELATNKFTTQEAKESAYLEQK